MCECLMTFHLGIEVYFSVKLVSVQSCRHRIVLRALIFPYSHMSESNKIAMNDHEGWIMSFFGPSLIYR